MVQCHFGLIEGQGINSYSLSLINVFIIASNIAQVQVLINNVNDNYPEITTKSMTSIKNTNVGNNEGNLDVDLNIFWFVLKS